MTFWDASLWLAVTASILLASTELISSYHGKISLLINKKRIKHVALAVSSLYLIMIVMKIIGLIYSI